MRWYGCIGSGQGFQDIGPPLNKTLRVVHEHGMGIAYVRFLLERKIQLEEQEKNKQMKKITVEVRKRSHCLV